MLGQLQVRVSQAPTVMDLAAMKGFILELMAVPEERLRENSATCCNVVELLAASFSAGTYFEVVLEEKLFFVNFATWIKRLAAGMAEPVEHGLALESLASVFVVFPEDVYGHGDCCQGPAV